MLAYEKKKSKNFHLEEKSNKEYFRENKTFPPVGKT
jgi:hypothetical protein